MRGDVFLEQFLLHPTLAELDEHYRYKYKCEDVCVYHREKLREDCFERLLQEYFSEQGNPIPAEVAEAFVRLAEAYAKGGYVGDKYLLDHVALTQHYRLEALIVQPTFIADECAVSVMKALKDVTGSSPWGFCMWGMYGSSQYLRSGFGETQIAGFHRLILCDDLWTGKCEDMHGVFFTSVAQALRILSLQDGFLRQTVQPRIDLLNRSWKYGRHHGPTCKGSFLDEEMEALSRLAENDESVRAAVEEIEKSGMRHVPHLC